MKKLLHINENIDDKEFEYCVLCGKKTDVRINMPIDLRDYYIESCGQLCMDCVASLLETNPDT